MYNHLKQTVDAFEITLGINKGYGHNNEYVTDFEADYQAIYKLKTHQHYPRRLRSPILTQLKEKLKMNKHLTFGLPKKTVEDLWFVPSRRFKVGNYYHIGKNDDYEL